MRLEWIDDILAVLDTGSLARAAERRLLTQSAFSRRVRLIEDSIGVTLFDRRRKPVTLMPGIEALAPELRDLSARLARLGSAMRLSGSQMHAPLTFACQHSITTTVAPGIVSELASVGETSVRVRSGNRDECLMRLLSGEAEFAIMYEVPEERAAPIPRAFEAVTLGTDRLVPVCTPALRPRALGPEIPTVSYPPDIFLGRIFDRMLGPRLPKGLSIASRAESELTLAVLEFVLGDIGIAWLPRSLVAGHIARGQLVCVDDILPAQALDIAIIRLSGVETGRGLAVWRHITERLRLADGSEGIPDRAPGLVQTVERAEE